MNIWQLLQPIFQVRINGVLILNGGENYEMHVLPS
jgi:hypothetical protein